ncbi:hypothetical protein M758_2G108500 [Ceratodon purpureus]|nr:hypothetical protein M758_2G108500 [Ceratodon purpureus]
MEMRQDVRFRSGLRRLMDLVLSHGLVTAWYMLWGPASSSLGECCQFYGSLFAMLIPRLGVLHKFVLLCGIDFFCLVLLLWMWRRGRSWSVWPSSSSAKTRQIASKMNPIESGI